MKDLAIFVCEVHGSTIIVSHGEVMYIDSYGSLSPYNQEEKTKSLWLEVVAGHFKHSSSWKRIL